MGQRSLRLIGFVLATFSAASAQAAAQEVEPMPPMPMLPAIPKFDAPPDRTLVEDAAQGVEPKLDVPISPNTGMPRLESGTGSTLAPIALLALQSSDYVDPRYIQNSQHPDDPGPWERFRATYGEQVHRSLNDYKNFYLSDNLLYVGVAVAVAAPLANTKFDQHFRDWYQRQAGHRTRGPDRTADFINNLGEAKYAVPGYLVCSLSGHLFPDNPTLETIGDFGNRGLRGLAVGAPIVGILQVGLGSDRPVANDSRWQPFRSAHGVSGHAFVGAVPFLTAASMTDCRPLQVVLFAGSFATSWSGLQSDRHYFSQALLGWSIAYLAVHAVNETEGEMGRMRLVPVEIPNGVGVGLQIDF